MGARIQTKPTHDSLGHAADSAKTRNRKSDLSRSNLKSAQNIWGNLSKNSYRTLFELTNAYGVSVAAGHLQLLDGRWYITHSGLLQVAHRRKCAGITTTLDKQLSDSASNRWVFRATVYKPGKSRGFVGYGDADPSNTSPLVRGAEMRVAETRAVNRALRKAYGIGLCSVEELGSLTGPSSPVNRYELPAKPQPPNGSNNGQPRLKDKLCLLIRQYNLDANLVKAYAAEFCGTETLRGATRELVESFISHLEKQAKESRESLICKLNSYSHPEEVHS
jgi:hypothetical protein